MFPKCRYRQHQSSRLPYERQPEAERHGNYSCSSQDLHRSKPEGFCVELSNLYITKEDLVEVFCNKFKAEILKA
jgi:hypothetical protein